MDQTQCKIMFNHSNSNDAHSKMAKITLEGTSNQIFNCHKEINYVRQHGRLMTDKERKASRFANSFRNKNKNGPKKLINWDLDVTDERMLETVNCILSESHSTNWAVFKFADVASQQSLKRFECEECGETGVHGLALRLQDVSELKYCVLRFEYGLSILRNQIILLIYSPSTSHSYKRNIIPILRHKSLIKKTLSATTEITISIHSYLNSSFILSELYAKNLVEEILLRVTLKNDKNESNDKCTFETDKVFVSRQWTLRQLMKHLATKCNAMNEAQIQITHILYNVKTRASKFNSRRQTEHTFTKEDLDQSLTELDLYHGSRIYVFSNTDSLSLSNTFLAAQRRAEFTNERIKITKTKRIKIRLKLSSHIKQLHKRKSKTQRLPQKHDNVRHLATKYESISKRHHYRQPSVSDGEDEMDTTESYSARNRSLSTSVIINVDAMENAHVQETLKELGKTEIFKPVVVKSAAMKKALPPVIKEDLKEEAKDKEIECNLDLNQVFIVERNVARGKTASVHYAIYRETTDVALKEFRFGRLTSKILFGFHSELAILQKLDHHNICRLLGHFVDENSQQLYLAFEWLPCGCLYDVIHDDSVQIEWNDVLEMSMDIAYGMQYLHSMDIVHRDLKSHNLLLDETYRVKITDFGTAKTMETITGTTFTEVGTGGYCAPEVIEPPLEGYDRRVDVFSYGVLLWEIYSRKNVFDQRCLRNMNQLQKGIRPPIDNECPQTFKNLIHDCWHFDPKERPNFDQIVATLESICLQQQM